MIAKPFEVWHDTPEEISVLLTLPIAAFDTLPAEVQWNSQRFIKKHKTLGEADKLEELFEQFISSYPLVFKKFLNDLRSAKKGENKSIVARCEVTNFEELFEFLLANGIKLPLQPAHVTLYSIAENKGIGIDTVGEMNALPKVSIPNLTDFIQRIKV